MTEILEQVVYVFGSGTILLAAAAWLLRKLFSQLLSKDIETFKEELRLTNERRLSEFTHQLEKARLEHEIRFSALHQLRFEKLNLLHLKARELTNLLYEAIRPQSEGREKRYNAARNAIQDTNAFILDIELFLPKEFAESWSSALRNALLALEKFESTVSWQTQDFHADGERLSESVRQVIESTRNFQIQLVDLARELLESGGIGQVHSPTNHTH